MQSPLTTDRGKLRMERLRQLELEQLQWEQEALVMPEDLNRALFLSFASVKTEFSDLDGLSWPRYPVPLVTNPWAVEEPTPKLTCTEIDEFPTAPDSTDTRAPILSHHYSSKSLPYSSPRAEMPSYAQDTIRISRLAQPSWGPLQPANQFFSYAQGSPYAVPPPNLTSACHSPPRLPTQSHSLHSHQ